MSLLELSSLPGVLSSQPDTPHVFLSASASVISKQKALFTDLVIVQHHKTKRACTVFTDLTDQFHCASTLIDLFDGALLYK
jgi:hypothetical protein